jgi:hypothetical protein
MIQSSGNLKVRFKYGKKISQTAKNERRLILRKITIYIVTCVGVCMTKITGSRSDDWIYWQFGYNLSFNYN